MMNYLNPVHFVTAQSMTSTFHSSPVHIMLGDNVGLQFQWTGTPTGTFTIEASMDYQENPSAPGDVTNTGNWTTITVSPSITQPTGSTGLVLCNLNQLPFPWIRLTYTAGSSTGTLDAWIGYKGV